MFYEQIEIIYVKNGLQLNQSKANIHLTKVPPKTNSILTFMCKKI